VATSLITFINHFVPMFSWNHQTSVFYNYYNEIFAVMSVLSFGVYLISMYICTEFLFTKDTEKEETEK
jgi:hypothetical protein